MYFLSRVSYLSSACIFTFIQLMVGPGICNNCFVKVRVQNQLPITYFLSQIILETSLLNLISIKQQSAVNQKIFSCKTLRSIENCLSKLYDRNIKYRKGWVPPNCFKMIKSNTIAKLSLSSSSTQLG